MNPEAAEWSTATKTNAILADIFDQLSMVNAQLRVLITHKRGKPPKPYKRPGQEDKNKQHFGKGALPITEMREWIKNRQKKAR